jgi:hypothetical protein
MAVRALLSVLPIEEVLRSYAYASLLCVPVLLVSSFGELLSAAALSSRFAPFSFHPNLVGFLAVSFISVQLWAFVAVDKRRYWFLGLSLIGIALLVLASSRGAIVALAGGVIALLLVHLFKTLKTGTVKVTPIRLATAVTIIVAVSTIASLKTEATVSAMNYLSDALAINSEYRGVNTGLTGRTAAWQLTVDLINANDSWLFGNGLRSSGAGSVMDMDIDNGYLTLVYDAGVLVASVIVLRLFFVLWLSAYYYVSSTEARYTRVYGALLLGLVAFLTNNIVARYLLGIGNPYSLLGIFLLVMTRRDFATPVTLAVPVTASLRA